MLPGDKLAKKNSRLGRLSRASIAPSDTVEDVDATLGASDAADVEEDDGGDDDADSDDDEITSKATGVQTVMRGVLVQRSALSANLITISAGYHARHSPTLTQGQPLG